MKAIMVQSRRTNLETASAYIDRLRDDIPRSSGSVIVMPEKWITDEIEFGSTSHSSLMETFREFSLDKDCIFIPGSLNVREGDTLKNRAYIFERGKYLGLQDKISLYRMESGRFTPGKKIEAFDCRHFKLGVSVCYDLDFPYYTKVMAERGVTVLANPSLIVSKYHRMWHIYVRGRSLENRIPVISVNSLSEPFRGNSIITGMRDEGDGIVLEEENAGSEEIYYSELDYSYLPELVRKRREEDPGVYAFPER